MKCNIAARNHLLILSLVTTSVACKNRINESDLLLDSGTVSLDLPITWKVQGDRNSGEGNSGCGAKLLVPAEIEYAIENAWSEAQELLRGPVKRKLVLLSQEEQERYATFINQNGIAEAKPPTAHIADYSKSGGVGLIEVAAFVKGERVSIFKGCIGTEKPTEIQNTNNQAFHEGQKSAEPVARKCWESSVTTATLKDINLRNVVIADCPPGGISAGFGLRTNTRSISLKAKWLIKGEIVDINMDQEFDYSSIDFYAGTEADLSGFAASVLPLPPGAKKIAGALLDSLGTIKATGELGDSRFLIPDQFNKRVKVSGVMKKKASNLAIGIASEILSKVCLKAWEKEMEPKRENCELDEKNFIRQIESVKIIDENYKKVPVNACEGQFLNAILYAKFRRPQVVPNMIDQDTGEPMKEKFFLTTPNETKMALWHSTGNVSSALNYYSDALFKGPAKDQSKCGKIDKNLEICEAFTIKSSPGTGLDCNKINSKQDTVFLSFVRDSAIMNETL